MNSDYKNMLTEYTCIIVKDKDVIYSKESGIKPVIQILQQGKNIEGYSVYDKIVGKAVASLLVLAKVGFVYAKTMSKLAKEYLEKYNLKFEYENLTDNIINRKNTGICPMEQTVLNLDNPRECFEALQKKLKQLK